MRLLLPSVIMAVYTFLSLVLPLKSAFWIKALLGAGLMAAGLKYVFYQFVGGGFFRPELPAPSCSRPRPCTPRCCCFLPSL